MQTRQMPFNELLTFQSKTKENPNKTLSSEEMVQCKVNGQETFEQ